MIFVSYAVNFIIKYLYFISICNVLLYCKTMYNRQIGLDVLGQSPRHNICTFIEVPCYLNCLLKLHILC